MATTELGRPRARLELPGSDSASVSLEVIYQPRATRVVRAVLILLVSFVLMFLGFFIPPHFVWPVVALAAGVYLSRRYWVGEFYVSSFDGACPRCGTAIEVKPGTRIRARQTLECYGCHRQPELVLETPEETAQAEGFVRPAPDVERRRGRDRRSDDRREQPAAPPAGEE